MNLGLDMAPEKNEYQESSWSKGRPAHKADNTNTISEQIA
jgi:hypothetical protein